MFNVSEKNDFKSEDEKLDEKNVFECFEMATVCENFKFFQRNFCMQAFLKPNSFLIQCIYVQRIRKV